MLFRENNTHWHVVVPLNPSPQAPVRTTLLAAAVKDVQTFLKAFRRSLPHGWYESCHFFFGCRIWRNRLNGGDSWRPELSDAAASGAAGDLDSDAAASDEDASRASHTHRTLTPLL